MDKRRFAELMAGISELFDKEISKGLAGIYWEALRAFSSEEIEAAFAKAVRSCKFFPKPADLIDFIQGTADDRIARAWMQLKEACESVGAYRSVVLEDPGLQAVVEAWGGWIATCHLPSEEWQYRYKQFRDLYRSRMDLKKEPKKLSGYISIKNIETGFPNAEEEIVTIAADGGKKQRLRLISGEDAKKIMERR